VIGFICGPGVAAITSLPALQVNVTIGSFPVHIGAETSPGFVSALFALAGLLALIPFKDVPSPFRDGTRSRVSQFSLFHHFGRRGGVSLSGVLCILFSVFAFTTAFTMFETLGPLYCTDNPDLKFTVLQIALTFGLVSVNALLALVLMQVILRFVVKNERLNLIGFGFFTSAGLILLFDWTTGFVGFWRFTVAIFCVSFGFTVNQALTLVIFSRILEGIEQGVMMGWLSSTSSIARMICPIAASYAFAAWGANYIFLVAGILTIFSNCAFIVFWRSLTPRVVMDSTGTIQTNTAG